MDGFVHLDLLEQYVFPQIETFEQEIVNFTFIVPCIIIIVSKNNQHDDTCGTEHVGEREGYSKTLHTIPEDDCTGKNELLMMSFPRARNM